MAEPGHVGRHATRQFGQGTAQPRAHATPGRAVENPAAFLETFQQAGLAQKLEMARNPRLGLADNFDQFAHGQLGFAQQQQQAQPGGIARRAQHGHKPVHRTLLKHINISLYA